MPLDKNILKQGIKAMSSKFRNNENLTDDDYAEELSTLIINTIKSATVTVNPGIPVATSSGAGSTSGPGTGSLS